MTRFYIIRHGQSEFNSKHIMQGHLDSKLSEFGIKQALAAKKYLKRYKFDVAYSSDLSRAYDTAKIILEGRDMKIHISKKLRERDYGILNGMVMDKFIKHGYFTNDIHEFGGENEEDVAERAMKIFKKIAEKEEGKKVFIASHEVVISHFLKQLDPVGLGYYHDGMKLVNNCSTTIVDYKDGKFKIVKLGYDEYMKDVSE